MPATSPEEKFRKHIPEWRFRNVPENNSDIHLRVGSVAIHTAGWVGITRCASPSRADFARFGAVVLRAADGIQESS
jgi:hypothetical protein